MLYVISKVLWIILQPSAFLMIVLVTGLSLTRTRRGERTGKRLAWFAAASLLLCGVLPVSTLLLLPLENRFPTASVPQGSADYAGIIVLGGAEDGRISAARGQLHTNEAGERISQAATLALRLPTTRIAFTGGAAFSALGEISAAEPIAAWWISLGISPARIITENRSRTTYENALYLRQLLKPKPGERWLLVTSAAHMPRAMGVFRHTGFTVTAYPVDFRTSGLDELADPSTSIPAGLKRLDDAAKEWIGLLAYWLMGRTSALFPGPAP
ncbi:MAG: YdcF family protein [Hyphomicrobiaceae bacterium]